MKEQHHRAKRKTKATPFAGEINPYQRAETYQAPAWMPKRGREHPADARQIQTPPIPLIAAARQLRAAVLAAGGEWGADRFEWLSARYPDGVPEQAIEALAAELTAPAETAPAAGLRLVR